MTARVHTDPGQLRKQKQRDFPLRSGTMAVLRKELLTPRMLRITFCGADLADLPLDFPGEIITLSFRGDELRNYTVARYDPAGPELDVEFVLHEPRGPACIWAATAEVGDEVGFAGPRIDWAPLPGAEWLLLAGDETTLPLIKAVLASEPPVSRTLVVVEIRGDAERQPLGGAEVVWADRRGAGAGAGAFLEDAVRALALPDGPGQAWVAGESIVVKGVREHLKQERGMPRGSVRAIGWWLHRSNPEFAEVDED